MKFTVRELLALAVTVNPVLLEVVSLNVTDPGLTGVRITTGVIVNAVP
jgi:hypothetical protein